MSEEAEGQWVWPAVVDWSVVAARHSGGVGGGGTWVERVGAASWASFISLVLVFNGAAGTAGLAGARGRVGTGAVDSSLA